jgi:alkylation response protein AidB-like acyl-CoA dehydrogenase
MPDDDIEEMRSVTRAFLAKQASPTRLRQHIESVSGYDRDLWLKCASELGLQAMTVPEQFGGGDFGLTELGVIFEELGRALACAPFFSTLALAVPALSRADPAEASAQLLGSIADGTTTATFTWTGIRPSETAIKVSAAGLTGTLPIVVDGSDVDVVLVAARSADDAVGLYVVRSVDATPLVALDHTRRLAQLTLDHTIATPLATNVGRQLDDAAEVSGLLLAAEALGVAGRAMEEAVEYARTRVQFGRRIGSFQAVKHRCANMLVDVELARSLVYHALHLAQRDPSTLALEGAIARSFAADVAVSVAAGNLQIHGGIGFTWEHSAHLYLKRAKSSQLLLGRPELHRARAAVLLGISKEAS